MHALDWIKSKAKPLPVDTIEVVKGDCAHEDGCEPGTYEIHTVAFRGTLPSRMVAQLKRSRRPLETGLYVNEVLHLGGQYRSDYGKCEYTHTTYKRVA